MGKIEEAIKKINIEIQARPNDHYLALIGEYTIDQITTEETAEGILATEKTLAGAIQDIEQKARKRAVGNCAVIEGAVVYSWAREYFGIAEAAKPQAAAENTHLSLDDFF